MSSDVNTNTTTVSFNKTFKVVLKNKNLQK